MLFFYFFFFFFSSRRRHTRSLRDWSSDVCSSDLGPDTRGLRGRGRRRARRRDGRRGGDRVPHGRWPPGAGGGRVSVRLERRLEQPWWLSIAVPVGSLAVRSEERRVGKEGRARWAP